MSKGNLFKRCGCRDPETGRRLGQKCPRLRTAGGRWSRDHGSWYWQIELPAGADGTRRPLRHGTYDTQADAEKVLNAVRAALAVPDPTDMKAQIRLGDIIADVVKSGEPIPEPDAVRQLLNLDMTPSDLPNVAEYLTRWLKGRKKIKAGTRRSYEAHIRLHLNPQLGQRRIDKLRGSHIDAMFDAIVERNHAVTERRGSRDPSIRDTVKGLRFVGAATQHRILATLRVALNDAVRKRLISNNVALLVELPPAKAPKALLWTAERVQAWRKTGNAPSSVMVWTPAQTGAFLDHAYGVNDRLYALYHLIAFSGLRRGEACGVRWEDIDLNTANLTVRWQIVQHGWATAIDTPKTDESDSVVALDAGTVAILRAHRTQQRRERLAAGVDWVDTGLVFTTRPGDQLHPANVLDHFRHLTKQAGLPPVRLHDLRHGTATFSLAAGVDMKVISGQLRHSDPHFTAAAYAHILPELAHSAAEATAAMVPLRRQEATTA